MNKINLSSSSSTADHHPFITVESGSEISLEGVKARASKVLRAKREKERQLAEAGLLKRKKKKVQSRWEQKQEQEKKATQDCLLSSCIFFAA